ncbi:MAG: hypothetical protein ACKPAC_17480 [Alphaproteobacteria bacterium]
MRLAGALLLLWFAFGVPAMAQQAPTVGFRVGNHPTYGRVVMDWPEAVTYRAEEAGNRLTLRFDAPARYDLSGALRLPKNVEALSAIDGGVVLQAPPGTRFRHYRLGNRVVIDVLDGAETSEATPPVGTASPPAAAPARAAGTQPAPIACSARASGCNAARRSAAPSRSTARNASRTTTPHGAASTRGRAPDKPGCHRIRPGPFRGGCFASRPWGKYGHDTHGCAAAKPCDTGGYASAAGCGPGPGTCSGAARPGGAPIGRGATSAHHPGRPFGRRSGHFA